VESHDGCDAILVGLQEGRYLVVEVQGLLVVDVDVVCAHFPHHSIAVLARLGRFWEDESINSMKLQTKENKAITKQATIQRNDLKKLQ
jgi:hypothetical protein